MIALLGLFAGVLQIGFGALRLGGLIKYMPYTVVSGYLKAGVGALYHCKPNPKTAWNAERESFLGVFGCPVYVAMGRDCDRWRDGCDNGFSQKITKAVPAAILALLAEVLPILLWDLWSRPFGVWMQIPLLLAR